MLGPSKNLNLIVNQIYAAQRYQAHSRKPKIRRKKKSVAKRSKTMTFKNHLNNCLRVLNKKLLTSCVLQRQQNLKIDKYTNER